MKGFIFNVFLLLISGLLHGQAGSPFKIENDTLIYEFKASEIDSMYQNQFSIIHDFDSLKIADAMERVASFVLQDDWFLKVLSDGTLYLKKALDDFNDVFLPVDKYAVLSEYWLYPKSKIDSFYIPRMKNFKVTESGNAIFNLDGNRNANKVILTGNFNGWDEHTLEMTETDDGWKLGLQLEPGIYEYKFIVDGSWTHDVKNSLKLINEHETYNSILLIGDTHLFKLEGHLNANRVYLSGSFNNWDEKSLRMKKTESGWEINLEIPPGKHYYKFIIGGEWITDPNNELMEEDKYGRKNSVLLIN